ncbi:hypothetical protein BH11MYX3_BH11MYX3_27910 [soil metagenome]
MRDELDPVAVAQRLAAVRAYYVPESVADAADRLARERPPSTETFELSVARNLEELRALCDLVDYLQTARAP